MVDSVQATGVYYTSVRNVLARGGILKSEAIRDAARVLAAEGLATTTDLRAVAVDESRLEQSGMRGAR
ncbi:hypothetical protein [Mycolicibacter senuensis]|uniref:hypothetical protein n=1 Tax=Mycolicibacter senuensis TaxID=386913 RepID=UPI0025710D64|nr:hypothetical protein [Mycolicibacter senuensis]